MLNIYLSVNNREEVIKLPVVPPEFPITKPKTNQTFETVSGAQLKRIGCAGLKGITINSFFPVRDYPFLRDRTYVGQEYVYIIDTWYNRRLPIRLVISETPINMVVTIDAFDYVIRQDGNIYYTLTLSEFPLLGVDDTAETSQSTVDNAADAITFLSGCGIINTPEVWYQGTWTSSHLKTMIRRVAECIGMQKTYTLYDAVNILVDKGIINTPSVWLSGTYTEDNFRTLLVKIANYISENCELPLVLNGEETTPVTIDNATDAITFLYEHGIINTPEVWYQGTWLISHLELLLERCAAEITCIPVYTLADAVYFLSESGIIDTPSIWIDGTFTEENVRTLLVKLAQLFAEG